MHQELLHPGRRRIDDRALWQVSRPRLVGWWAGWAAQRAKRGGWRNSPPPPPRRTVVPGAVTASQSFVDVGIAALSGRAGLTDREHDAEQRRRYSRCDWPVLASAMPQPAPDGPSACHLPSREMEGWSLPRAILVTDRLQLGLVLWSLAVCGLGEASKHHGPCWASWGSESVLTLGTCVIELTATPNNATRPRGPRQTWPKGTRPAERHLAFPPDRAIPSWLPKLPYN